MTCINVLLLDILSTRVFLWCWWHDPR